MSNSDFPAGDANDARSGTTPEIPRLILHSRELFQGRREIWIEHASEMYRLRITSKGRLILTK